MTSEAVPDYTYIVHHPREEILSLLPNAGVVAEIGVAEGHFAAAILNRNRPRRLHLIDAWRNFDAPAYQIDPCNQPAEVQERRFLDVQQRFSRELGNGQVLLHRQLSGEAAAEFEREYFDWIYVDAMHDQESVQQDLTAYFHRVKPDGFICGHDYANHPLSRQLGFGVIPAVNAFVKQFNLQLLLVTDELFASYVIAKDANSLAFRVFEQRLLGHCSLLKVRNFLDRRFGQEICVDRGGNIVRSVCVVD